MRDYENTPRPDVEQHPYIRMLIDGQNKRALDRTYHQNRIKASNERDTLIADAKLVELVDFWCRSCKKDFKGVAIKQVEVDWNNAGQNIAFYKTKCFCGAWSVRWITDKHRDPYWVQSKEVSRDQGEHYADMVQPFMTGFNMLYGRKNKSI